MMEFIHHDVIKGAGVKALQMFIPSQRLNRGKNKIGFAILRLTCVITETRLWLNAGKGILCLHQNLFPVGDEQYTPCLSLLHIEGRYLVTVFNKIPGIST